MSDQLTPNCQSPSPSKTKILAFCDSVVARPGHALTGFGRVAKNLFTEWSKIPGLEIDIWALGFDGHGYKGCPWQLIPVPGHNWNSVDNLNAFLRQLACGGYTHVWMLMDADALSPGNFPEGFKQVCKAKKIHSTLYYPVDAPLQKPWGMIEVVDRAVCFTEYGKAETRRALGRSLFQIDVLPHGIDSYFTPLAEEERQRYRNEFQVPDGSYPVASGAKPKLKPFLNPGDFLIVNVNKNEWRKDPLRSLEILKGLRDRGIPAKLIMRMNPTSLNGGVHLERAAEQLGLTIDEHWAHIPPVPEEHLRGLYGAADLYLTTALGEGWGLGVTEALACGTPVVCPGHTSLLEIGGKAFNHACHFLELETSFVCGSDTRLRQRVNLDSAVESIERCIKHRQVIKDPPPFRAELIPAVREWLSWPRVANEFLKLMNLI